MPILCLTLFALAYALFVVFPARRSVAAVGAAAALVLAGALAPADLPWRAAVAESFRRAFVGGGGAEPLVNWNVLGLFFGMLVLAELFLMSKAPAVIAEAMLARLSSARAAMLALCALSGAISIAVENVAVVLLLAPIALSLADRLKTSPAPLLVGIAICSNVQGTATMIGDPPSMILAGEMKMGFFDFFFFHGRPGIFFAIQVGAIASLGVLAWVFRGQRGRFSLDIRETARSWVPAGLLCVLIAGLAFSSAIDPDFRWFAGTITMTMGFAGFLWNALRAKWIAPGALFRSLDWDTTAFLAGVFVLVGGLSGSGWLERLASCLANGVGGSAALAFVAIIALAVAVSGFVDNVPFLLAMIPVVKSIAAQMAAAGGASATTTTVLLLFGLLTGACLGGNVTPIGASANVTAIGILRRRGIAVRFRDFMSISVPFTIVAVLASSIFVWIVWHT